MIEKATGTWDKLEKVFEDRVARALHALNVPSHKDVNVLSERVYELTAITKKLAEEEERPRACAQGESRVSPPQLAGRLGAGLGPGMVQ